MTPVVLLFVASGCPACHEYGPRLSRLSAPLRARGLRVHVLDVASSHRAVDLAQRFGVDATPTTVARLSDGSTRKIVGAVADAEIETLMAELGR